MIAGGELPDARPDPFAPTQKLIGRPIAEDDPAIAREKPKPDIQLVQRLLGLMLMALAGADLSVYPRRLGKMRQQPLQEVDRCFAGISEIAGAVCLERRQHPSGPIERREAAVEQP